MTAAPAPAIQPRDLVSRSRGSVYPMIGAAPASVVSYVQRLWSDGEQDALGRFKRATHNLMYMDGRQWIDWSLKDKLWREQPTLEGRVRVTMNYVRPIVRARIQRLLSSDINWNIHPKSNDLEEQDRATVGTNFLTNRAERVDLDSKTRLALWFAAGTGVAYLKQFWNPNIGPLSRATLMLPNPDGGWMEAYVSPDRTVVESPEEAYTYRPGDVDSALRTIFNIRTNPDAWGLEPDEGFRWLIDADVVPISVVKEKYGSAADRVQSVDNLATMRQYEQIVRALAQKPGGPSPGGNLSDKSGSKLPDRDLTMLMEYWEDPSEAMPEGRLTVVAGQEMLHDDSLPQGFVPYLGIYDERRPFDSYGRPTVDDLVPPQKVLNKQWSLILEEMGRSGIGQWIGLDIPGLADQISTIPDAITKIPMKAMYGFRSVNDVLQRLGPTRISQDRWRLIEEAKRTMFDIGAFHEIQRGQVPPGVDSGVAVEALQEAENAQLQDAVRGLKRSLIRWGEQSLRMARWGYGDNEERWIPVNRPDLGYLVQAVRGPDLPDPDEITIDIDHFQPKSEAAFRAEVREAVNNQWITPRRGMQLLDLGRGLVGDYESQNRHYTRARRENLALERGQFQVIEHPPESPLKGLIGLLNADKTPMLLPSDDDHVIHIELHQEIGLDDTKPWEVRQAALFHIAEHRAMLQAQMIAEAEASAPRSTEGTSDE